MQSSLVTRWLPLVMGLCWPRELTTSSTITTTATVTTPSTTSIGHSVLRDCQNKLSSLATEALPAIMELYPSFNLLLTSTYITCTGAAMASTCITDITTWVGDRSSRWIHRFKVLLHQGEELEILVQQQRIVETCNYNSQLYLCFSWSEHFPEFNS